MIVPVAVAVAVFCSGFGMLAGFWFVGGQGAAPGLPGLFDFASATWGDGLALPAMTGFFAAAVRGLPPARGERWAGWMAGLFGGTAGGAVQAWWLLAERVRLSWTLPRPHHFTAAGWYHAVFVVAVCALTATLHAVALQRLRRVLAAPCGVYVKLAGGVGAGMVFVGLLAVDQWSVGTADDDYSGLLGAGLGLLIAVGVAVAVVWRGRRARPPVS